VYLLINLCSILIVAAAGAAAAANFPTLEEKQEADARSVHVGNVDYSSTAKELGQHFQGCGAVFRVTIMCDKFSGNPKGLVSSVVSNYKLNDACYQRVLQVCLC